MNKIKHQIHKLLHWEYWPMQLVYLPLMPVWLYFALRARSFFFFNAANPTIKNGGMAMESKKEIYDLMPSELIPKTLFFESKTMARKILDEASAHNIKMPFIIKPDIGMKGLAVQIIKTSKDLNLYLAKSSDNLLIQELIEYPNEAGIFYCRIPGEQFGRITGIVHKEFLSVTGNGKESVLQLINNRSRTFFQLKALKKMYGNQLNDVLPKGQTFVLVPYGSHTRGAMFIDYTSRVNNKLNATIDNISKRINGFYYGRLDIRYQSWDDLCLGKNFKIIELNGAGSEPTHIYDPSHSLLFAWKEIISHWNLLYKVSRKNFSNGHNYLNFSQGRMMLSANSLLEKKLKAF